MKIIWRDTFTAWNTELDLVKEDIKNKTGVAVSYGKIVFADKNYIVLEQNHFIKIAKHNDFIIIPRRCIISKK